LQPAAVGPERGLDGQHRRLVVGIGLALPAGGIDDLAKIAFLIQQPDAVDGDVQVTGRLEYVAGEYSEAASIERQRLTDAEFHAEVSDTSELG